MLPSHNRFPSTGGVSNVKAYRLSPEGDHFWLVLLYLDNNLTTDNSPWLSITCAHDHNIVPVVSKACTEDKVVSKACTEDKSLPSSAGGTL